MSDRTPPKPKPDEFIDPGTITKQQMKRIHACAKEIMARHEHLFSDDIPDKKIIARDSIAPELLDIPQIFHFSNLNYMIFKKDTMWHIRILSGRKMLIEAAYAKF